MFLWRSLWYFTFWRVNGTIRDFGNTVQTWLSGRVCVCVCVGTVCVGECLRRDVCRSSMKSLRSDTFCEVKWRLDSDPTRVDLIGAGSR